MSRPGPGQVIDDKLDAAPDPPGWWCRPPRCSIVPATARGMAAIGEDGEGQGAVISTGQTAVRRAISPGNEGSLMVTRTTPQRRSGRTTASIAQIPKLIVRLLSPILATWDVHGMQRSRW